MINGAKTLEMDNGITKVHTSHMDCDTKYLTDPGLQDGVVVVWHDENIVPEKCQDTSPAFPGDPDFPYVGRFVANLTFAQLRTIDCGSKRQDDFPSQLTYPGTRISTQKEVFDFVACADPRHQMRFNIESKIDAAAPNLTLGVNDFVTKQHAVFQSTPYRDSITVCVLLLFRWCKHN